MGTWIDDEGKIHRGSATHTPTIPVRRHSASPPTPPRRYIDGGAIAKNIARVIIIILAMLCLIYTGFIAVVINIPRTMKSDGLSTYFISGNSYVLLTSISSNYFVLIDDKTNPNGDYILPKGKRLSFDCFRKQEMSYDTYGNETGLVYPIVTDLSDISKDEVWAQMTVENGYCILINPYDLYTNTSKEKIELNRLANSEANSLAKYVNDFAPFKTTTRVTVYETDGKRTRSIADGQGFRVIGYGKRHDTLESKRVTVSFSDVSISNIPLNSEFYFAIETADGKYYMSYSDFCNMNNKDGNKNTAYGNWLPSISLDTINILATEIIFA